MSARIPRSGPFSFVNEHREALADERIERDGGEDPVHARHPALAAAQHERAARLERAAEPSRRRGPGQLEDDVVAGPAAVATSVRV